MVLDHAALLHTVRLADQVDGDVHGDLLVAAHHEEVDVQELPANVVALDLPGHRQMLVLADLKVDQHVRSGSGVQDVVELAPIQGELERLHPVPVQDAGHEPPRAELASGALAPAVTQGRRQLGLGHRRPPGRMCGHSF